MKDYFNDIQKIFNENIAVGKPFDVVDNIKLVPIFKVNINYLAIDNGSEEKNSNGSNTNISITPLCLLQVANNEISLVSLTEKNDFMGKVPNILETLSDTFKIGELFKAA